MYSEKDKVLEIINDVGNIVKELIKEGKENLNKEITLIKETNVLKLLSEFLNNDLMGIVECDEENYCYHSTNRFILWSD